MSKEFTEEHKKLYQYAANSNLVLPSERARNARRGERGREAESLWSRIDPREMGSRVQHEAPAAPAARSEEEERASRERKLRRREQQSLRTNYGYGNILAATEDMEGMYRPRTQETRRVWELVLAQSRTYLGDQTPEVLLSAADEALAVLKDDSLRDAAKKKQVESLFGAPVGEAEFSRFIQLARQITDYGVSDEAAAADDAAAAGGPDDEGVVAVMFGDGGDGDDNDDDDADMLGAGDAGPTSHVIDGGSSDDDGSEDEVGPAPPAADAGAESGAGQEGDDDAGGYRTVIHGYREKDAKKLNQRNAERARAEAAAASTTVSYGADAAQGEGEAGDAGADVVSGPSAGKGETDKLVPRSVDAFWLQREVGRHYADPVVVQEKTREAARLMADSAIVLGELENELAELFDYEHFDTVQALVGNRDVIVWCMRLARAEAESDHDQLRAIGAQMRDLGLAWIIAARTGAEGAAAPATADEAAGEEGAPAAAAAAPREFVPTQMLSLAELAFAQGGHLMTNEKWVPPKGAVKTVMAGYEEIRVPAPEKLPPPGADDPLVELGALPEWTHVSFQGVAELNRVQSRVFPTAFGSDDNMLICAPTGAGKTNCAALTMLRTIAQFRDGATGQIDADAFKMVYIAPMKALVSEMAGSFAKRLEPLGLRVAELTGDSQLTKQQISETQLIVTTPEKWDVVTRKGGEGSYTALVRLVVIDEIHLLHDDRGPVLEALVCRLLRTQEQTQERVRLVGLSATLPNYEDVATFLRVPRDAVFHFDARYRPCPLQLEFVGITEKKHIRRLERMDEVCYAKVKRHVQDSQVLVFVHSRKET
ncbi:Pre-mRNA splicing, partial [Coemansia nantahalensis]